MNCYRWYISKETFLLSYVSARELHGMLCENVEDDHGFNLDIGKCEKRPDVAGFTCRCYLYTTPGSGGDHTRLPEKFRRKFGLAYLEANGTLTHELGLSLVSDKIKVGSCGGGRVLLRVDGTMTEESF